MEIRYEKIKLCRPNKIIGAEKYSPYLEVYVVQDKEKQDSVPQGETPIEWTLYSSHIITNSEDALQIVKYYTMKWNIEDLFRTMKSEALTMKIVNWNRARHYESYLWWH